MREEQIDEMLNATRAQSAREMYEHLTKWESVETAPRDTVILCAWPPLKSSRPTGGPFPHPLVSGQ